MIVQGAGFRKPLSIMPSYKMILIPFIAFAALAMWVSALPASHDEMVCDMADDGDCCNVNTDCVAAVNASLCTITPLNHIAAAKAEVYDPELSLCDIGRIEQLKINAHASHARCAEHTCEIVDGD